MNFLTPVDLLLLPGALAVYGLGQLVIWLVERMIRRRRAASLSEARDASSDTPTAR